MLWEYSKLNSNAAFTDFLYYTDVDVCGLSSIGTGGLWKGAKDGLDMNSQICCCFLNGESSKCIATPSW